MLSVQIDEREIEKRFQEELKKKLEEIQHRTTFWDMKELCRQTCMSENTVKEFFFYDPRFPKFRKGRKWYFPAEETKAFLLEWIKEQ